MNCVICGALHIRVAAVIEGVEHVYMIPTCLCTDSIYHDSKTYKPIHEKQVVWYARGGDVIRAGPFDSQIEATKSLILKSDRRDGIPEFPQNYFVWPEEVDG